MLLAKRGGMDTADAMPVIADGLTPEQIHAAEALSRTLYTMPDSSLRQ